MNKRNLAVVASVAFLAALVGSLGPIIFQKAPTREIVYQDSGVYERPEAKPRFLVLIPIDKAHPQWANAYLQAESAKGAELIEHTPSYLIVARPITDKAKARAEAQAYFDGQVTNIGR